MKKQKLVIRNTPVKVYLATGEKKLIKHENIEFSHNGLIVLHAGFGKFNVLYPWPQVLRVEIPHTDRIAVPEDSDIGL